MNNLEQNNDEWLSNLVTRKTLAHSKATRQIQLLAVGNTRQDMTLPILENLITQGYDMVQWDSGMSTHSVCRDLHGQVWRLVDFITGLNHSAPMAERAHPNCLCYIIMTGNGLQTIRCDYNGNMENV